MGSGGVRHGSWRGGHRLPVQPVLQALDPPRQILEGRGQRLLVVLEGGLEPVQPRKDLVRSLGVRGLGVLGQLVADELGDQVEQHDAADEREEEREVFHGRASVVVGQTSLKNKLVGHRQAVKRGARKKLP